MTGCLDDETVLGLIEGRLAAAAIASVEEHLDGCESCRDVIAGMAKARAPSHALERGAAIGPAGRYVIGELLGSGAMGHVYSAWQPELDRRVAIKVLRDDAGGARERLLREAQAMAKLDHPNVVGVHEVGTLGDDAVFVAMDLVEGATLREWADSWRERRDWRELCRVLGEIARGLAAVHAAGVVHRDIKPDNIIIGGDGRARLGDFGLARGAGAKIAAGRLADSVSFEDTQVATPNLRGGARTDRDARAPAMTPNAASGTSVAGTPVYMAPEVLRGGSASAASDQFAFGVTAYEVVAGKRPFHGATWAALAKAVETPAPPLRDVPGWLDGVIRRCIAADPAKRFGTLGMVATVLERGAQRRRPLWIAGALGAAAIASGVTYLALGGDREVAATGPSCTLGATEVAGVWNPRVKDQLSTLGPPTLAALDGWASKWASEHDAVCAAATTQPAPKVAARQQCLVRQRTELEALLAKVRPAPRQEANPPVANHEWNATGGELRPQIRVEETEWGVPAGVKLAPPVAAAQLASERMLDAVAALSPDDCAFAVPGAADPVPADPDRAKAVRDVERGLPSARAAIALGDPRPVIESSNALLAMARTSQHAPTVAEVQLVRADALRGNAQLAEAATAARDALAAAERGHDDAVAARASLARLAIAIDRRDLATADDLVEIASATLDRAGKSPRLALQLDRLRVQLEYNRGHFDKAYMMLTDVYRRTKELVGELSIEMAGVQSTLGSVTRASGDLDAAEKFHRAALAIDRQLRGERHPDVARDLHNVAGVLRLRGDLDAAWTTYQEALAIEVAIRGEGSVQAGLTHNSLGLVKLARKDYQAARSEFEHARAVLSAAGSGDRALAEHNLGLVAAATGDHEAALRYYDTAAGIFDSTVGADIASAVRIHLDRARSLFALGRREAAKASAERALNEATRANIGWIVEEARALLAGSPPKHPPITVEIGPRGSGTPPAQPTTATQPPVPDPPKPDAPKPKPKRDVGSYGAGQP